MDDGTEEAASDTRQNEKKKRQQEERTVKSLNEAGWRITVGDGNKWRERTELWKKKKLNGRKNSRTRVGYEHLSVSSR